MEKELILEESFIRFETAKLAKEKGFDVECQRFHNDYKYHLMDEGQISSYRQFDNWNSYAGIYSAPIQSLLQKWLREIHNIEVNAIPTGLKQSKRYLPRFWFSGYEYNGNDFESYEEALEKGLEEALKLI